SFQAGSGRGRPPSRKKNARTGPHSWYQSGGFGRRLRPMKSSLRFSILLVLILVMGAIVNALSYLGEAHVERKELKEFPQAIGAWRKSGPDQIISDETMQVLKASDYLLRDFHKPGSPIANLYVGYYESQRSGATYHSPLNCLPGSGWPL